MPPVPDQLAEKAKPWPSYFLVRPNGDVVPLIPVDELPIGTDLEGIPRSLELEDTIGMLNLGRQRKPGAPYQVVHQEKDKSSTDPPARVRYVFLRHCVFSHF